MKEFFKKVTSLWFSILFLSITGNGLAQLPYLKKVDGEVKVDKELYREYINNHPFLTRIPPTKEEYDKMNKKSRPDLAYELEWLMTHDPKTGKVEWQRLIPIIEKIHEEKQMQAVAPGGHVATTWTERGPDNVGGRTRAIMFDPTDTTNKKVYCGGVSGGLWYNNDITNSSSTWTSVDDFWSNLAISAIVSDPTDSNIWYVGTGEGMGNGDAMRGAGIWKSTNAGTSWTQLTNTNIYSFRYTLDLQFAQNGRLVVASSDGVFTSGDDGASFVRRSTVNCADLEMAANGDLYGGARYSGKVIKSTNNGLTWSLVTPTGTSTSDRVDIACAPSDSNTLYAVASNSGSNVLDDVEWFKKSTDGGANWSDVEIPRWLTDTSEHFTRSQAWYNLILWVHPTNKDVVIAGGINLHRTKDGGSTWENITNNWTYGSYPVIHADQHMIVTRPGTTNEIVVGNDGGVYYSSNAGDTGVTYPFFTHMVKNYNVTQFYTAAMHPGVGSDTIMGGSQDNGTHRSISAGVGSSTELTGGDGAYCFIDQSDPDVFITSFIYNNWRISKNGGGTFSYLSTDNTGKFINPADYDDSLNILYAAKTSTSIKKITNVTGSYSASDVTVSNLGGTPTHIRVSSYTTGSTTLFVGAGYDVHKITYADSSSPTVTTLTDATFPSEAISCIEIGANENELLVTFSSYGGDELYYTDDGGSTWSDKSGNLGDMPIRWALFNPKNRKEVILATEVGIWYTSDITATTPTWSSANLGMANTRVRMFQYRESDSLILAATYGRGMFTGRFMSESAPDASLSVDKTVIYTGDSVVYRSTSKVNPSTYEWTVTGGTPTSGTSDSIVVTYSSTGAKSIKLKVINSWGSDSVTESLVTVTAAPPLGVELIEFNVAKTHANGVKLEWQTASELNNDYFIIERSKNGTEWEGIQRIRGAGNSSVVIKYMETDNSPHQGISYYRLKQTDFDGHYEYSAVKSVNINASKHTPLRLYPNPTEKQITIEGDKADLEELKIYDLFGEEVSSQTHLKYRDDSKLVIDLSHLTNGIYYVKTKTITYKVYKQ
ncbi:MAG: hypothetical protein CL840_06820 [Crocinitomicaceae bacterium]|nr:hypothetical protein [Crocinitomicaceae bacterium]|tara:strand:- start:12234 stop:15389 length:3156 start_codon:yes stop_codon:yes gene_type:complete